MAWWHTHIFRCPQQVIRSFGPILNPQKKDMYILVYIYIWGQFSCSGARVGLPLRQVPPQRKAARPNKDINKILWAACAPDRLEWLMNNVRIRHAMTASYLWFLPSGTSSNEALHAEINSWTRSINVTHRSILAVKLQYFMYIKTLQHFLSNEFPMSRVVGAGMIGLPGVRNSIPLAGNLKRRCLWRSPDAAKLIWSNIGS